MHAAKRKRIISSNAMERSCSSTVAATVEKKWTPPIQQHPLLNSLILLEVLDYSKPNVEELKQIRLVCKTWHEITLSKWRSTAVIRLVPDTPFFSLKSCVEITVGDYLDEIRNEESPYQLIKTPYCRYKFQGMSIDLAACDHREGSSMFWERIGPLAQYVHFEKCTFMDSLGRDKPFVQLLVRKLPNVGHLALTDAKLENVRRKQKEIKISKTERRKTFRKCHPNLTTLTAHGGFDVGLGDLFPLLPKLESISAMDGSNKKVFYIDLMEHVMSTLNVCWGSEDKLEKGLTLLSNLKHLDLIKTQTFIYDSYLPAVTLNLKTFTATLRQQIPGLFHPFRMSTCRVQPNVDIRPFIVSLAPTLEVLKLFRAPFSLPIPGFLHHKQIEMTAMRELHLWGNLADTFEFLKITPNLEVLYINLGCFEKRKEMEDLIRKTKYTLSYQKFENDMTDLCSEYLMEEFVVSKLRTLHIDYAFPVKSLQMMADWMPNLKSLKTILTKRTLSVVCKQWENLTELVCLFGSTIENCNFVCNDEHKRRHCATIGDLKELERLQLDSLCGKSTHSDDCLFNGLLEMPALKCVQICVGEMMSDNAEEMLKQRFGLNCRLIRNYKGGDHSNYDCCARAKFELDCANDFKELKEKQESSESEDDEDAASSRSSSPSDSE